MWTWYIFTDSFSLGKIACICIWNYVGHRWALLMFTTFCHKLKTTFFNRCNNVLWESGILEAINLLYEATSQVKVTGFV